jgi:hypothetical protein
MSSQNEQSIVTKIPVKQGAIAGGASFLIGYIVTLGIVVLTEADDPDLIEFSGLLYYNAQFADAELTFQSGGGDESLGAAFETALSGSTLNYVTNDSPLGESIAVEAPAVVYHLLPVVVLITAGFVLARYISAQTIQEGVLAGGTVVVGTLPLSLLGVFIFTVTEEGTEVGPVLSDSILFVGLLFPIIFGALGGALNTQT